MSFVAVAPSVRGGSAADLASIGDSLNAARAATAAPTTGILAAAQDEVSAAIAAAFSAYGEGFQTLGAQIAGFHDQFVQT
jgi:PE family